MAEFSKDTKIGELIDQFPESARFSWRSECIVSDARRLRWRH